MNLEALNSWSPNMCDDCLREIDVARILDGYDAPDWLRSEATQLAADESVVCRGAALGLIGRLWTPPTMRAQITTRPDPIAQVTRQIGEIPIDVLRNVEGIACTHATGLFSGLRKVARTFVEHGDGDRLNAATRELAYSRDNLESVYYVLVVRHLGYRLGDVLHVVDDAVTSSWSSLPPAHSMPNCRRLAAVDEWEPMSWWGRFV